MTLPARLVTTTRQGPRTASMLAVLKMWANPGSRRGSIAAHVQANERLGCTARPRVFEPPHAAPLALRSRAGTGGAAARRADSRTDRVRLVERQMSGHLLGPASQGSRREGRWRSAVTSGAAFRTACGAAGVRWSLRIPRSGKASWPHISRTNRVSPQPCAARRGECGGQRLQSSQAARLTARSISRQRVLAGRPLLSDMHYPMFRLLGKRKVDEPFVGQGSPTRAPIPFARTAGKRFARVTRGARRFGHQKARPTCCRAAGPAWDDAGSIGKAVKQAVEMWWSGSAWLPARRLGRTNGEGQSSHNPRTTRLSGVSGWSRFWRGERAA